MMILKKAVLVLVLTWVVSLGRSQNSISVESVDSQWPDTTTLGANFNFNVLLKNLDSVFTYSDTINLIIEVDSAGTLYPVDTIFLGTQNINPLDTASFLINHTVSSRYSPGNNVVVIWPINGSGELGDSLTLDIFVLNPSFVEENERVNTFIVFPNPAKDFVFVRSRFSFLGDLPYAVYDSSGKLVLSGSVKANGKVDFSDLTTGYYYLELYTNNSHHLIF